MTRLELFRTERRGEFADGYGGIKKLKDGRIEGWKDDDSAGLVCMASRGIGSEMGLTELEG